MERIKQTDLEYLVNRINEVTNSPRMCFKRNGEKSNRKIGLTGNIGNYHLNYAYGGVQLVRIVSESGGIETTSTNGFGTKRELYNWMTAFLAGIKSKWMRYDIS